MEYIDKPLPKLILYIIMDDVFGQCDGKDGRDLGYHLQFIDPTKQNTIE